jgi:hypothetical protein
LAATLFLAGVVFFAEGVCFAAGFDGLATVRRAGAGGAFARDFALDARNTARTNSSFFIPREPLTPSFAAKAASSFVVRDCKLSVVYKAGPPPQ